MLSRAQADGQPRKYSQAKINGRQPNPLDVNALSTMSERHKDSIILEFSSLLELAGVPGDLDDITARMKHYMARMDVGIRNDLKMLDETLKLCTEISKQLGRLR